MADTVFRTSTHSWGGRLTGSIKGVLVGLIFGIAGISILVWNEGNSVREHKALEEGLKAVIDVPDIATINAENEGKLIHLIGEAETNAEVSDSFFGVTEPNALKLQRTVEMYQWVQDSKSQTRKNTGGSTSTKTTYSYTKQWKSEVVNSDTFEEPNGHQNPGSLPYQPNIITASPIDVGSFVLSQVITDKMNWWESISSQLSVENIPDESVRSIASLYGNNGFYFGSSPSNPEVGDTRVTFQRVREQTVSIVARQTTNTFSSYTTKSGGSVLLVEAGPHDALEMFQHANQALVAQTWMFRVMGFLFIFVMFLSVAKPLSVFADVVPCIGNIVEAGTGVISFLVAGAVAAVVIALSWLAYRPLFSLFILAVVGGLVYLVQWWQQRQVAGGHKYTLMEMLS